MTCAARTHGTRTISPPRQTWEFNRWGWWVTVDRHRVGPSERQVI
jgi:hypothetical protein